MHVSLHKIKPVSVKINYFNNILYTVAIWISLPCDIRGCIVKSVALNPIIHLISKVRVDLQIKTFRAIGDITHSSIIQLSLICLTEYAEIISHDNVIMSRHVMTLDVQYWKYTPIKSNTDFFRRLPLKRRNERTAVDARHATTSIWPSVFTAAFVRKHALWMPLLRSVIIQ